MQHDDHVRKFGYIHASECRAAVYDELDRTRSYGFRQRLDRPIRVLEKRVRLQTLCMEIPDTRPALNGVPFSTRDIPVAPLSPQAVALLEQVHVITGKFDLVFAGDAKPWKPMSENTVHPALRTMGYDTKVDICGHGFRAMACSALVEPGLWSETAIERQMSHKDIPTSRRGLDP